MESFKTRAHALRWLKSQGYKISKPHFYRACDNGTLILQPDGSVLMTAIERYIKLAELSQPAAETVAAAAAADAKSREEIKQLQLKNERLEHELGVMRGKYIEKTEADSYAADLAALLDALPRHILQLNGARYLAAIGADPQKARQLFELFDIDFTAAANQTLNTAAPGWKGRATMQNSLPLDVPQRAILARRLSPPGRRWVKIIRRVRLQLRKRPQMPVSAWAERVPSRAGRLPYPRILAQPDDALPGRDHGRHHVPERAGGVRLCAAADREDGLVPEYRRLHGRPPPRKLAGCLSR